MVASGHCVLEGDYLEGHCDEAGRPGSVPERPGFAPERPKETSPGKSRERAFWSRSSPGFARVNRLNGRGHSLLYFLSLFLIALDREF